MKWLQHACVNNDIEICLVNHKGLLALSGEQLAGLTAQQFIELDPYNGEDLFNELNQFRKYNKCKSAETNGKYFPTVIHNLILIDNNTVDK